MGSLLQQIRYVLRRLSRTPLFTMIVLLTLAVGIGANTAIFSVVNGVMLKPLDFREPERLVSIWHTAAGLNIPELNASPSSYLTYREENRSFEDVALWGYDGVTITGLAEPEQLPALDFSDGMLGVLGVQPVLGRGFTKADDSPGTPETIIISYGYWQRRFGGDRSVIGRRIIADGKAREIIGVLPQSFQFLDHKSDVFLPFRFERAKLFVGNFSYQAVARLKPGVTLEQANADVGRMIPITAQKFPPPPGMSLKMFEDARMGPLVRPLKHDLVGDIGSVLWVLMAAIGMVLLIACANVANLLLVRADGRRQELSIRAALGADWIHLARELLIESVVLGLLGGALGVGLSYAAVRIFVTLKPIQLPRLEELSIDGPVLLFAVAVSLVCGVLFGLVPVLKYAGPRLATSLREGGRALSQSRERHRARSVLVVTQVALALVLLISSGLMIRTFQALQQVNPGFRDPKQLLVVHIALPEAQIKDADAIPTYRALQDRIAAVPGVQSVAIGGSVTLDGNNSFDPVFAEDKTYAEGKLPPIRRYKWIAPGYLKTLGVPLVTGRDFTWADIQNLQPCVLVSEALAKEYWGNAQAAVGKRIRENNGAPWREVIGVVSGERDDGLNKPASSMVYWPIAVKDMWDQPLQIRRYVGFVVRSDRTGTQTFLKQIQSAVWAVNASLPISDVKTVEEIYRGSVARTSFTLVMLAIAGGMALLLGIVGIYGVISYSVSQRTREIGIRMALGARQDEVQRMFVQHGVVLTAFGVACGLAAAAAVTRWMAALLFGVSPLDPLTYGLVSAVLLGAAGLASYLPARRATAVNPVDALRAE